MSTQLAEEPTGRVTVVCGANTQSLAGLAGKRVSDVRAELIEVLNIPPDARAYVSGGNVDSNYQLQQSDTLEFVRPSGTKGNV